MDAKLGLHLVKLRQWGQKRPKIYIRCTSPGDGQTSRKVWLASGERRRCSNEANTRNPLKFVGVPQTRQLPVSGVSGRRSPFCRDTWRRYCCLTSFFPIFNTCLSCEDIARHVVRWCADGDFLAIFWVVCFQRAACSTFHTCILNSH